MILSAVAYTCVEHIKSAKSGTNPNTCYYTASTAAIV